MLRQAAASINSSVMISAWGFGSGSPVGGFHAYKGRPRPAEPPKTPAPAPKDGAKPTDGTPKPPEPPKSDK
jgi:hypothetical protein